MQIVAGPGHRTLVETLATAILAREIPEGSRLPGPEAYQVSRTAYREAVRVLGAKGLVESKQRTGTRVRARTFWNLLDPDVLAWQGSSALASPSLVFSLLEVRQIIEPPAAKLAAQRASKDQRKQLRLAYQAMAGAAAAGNRDLFIAFDMKFHSLIFEACGNELVQRMSRTVEAALWSSRHLTSRGAPAEASLPIHHEIMESICERRPDDAEAAMRRLLIQVTADATAALNGTRRQPRKK